MSEHTDKGKDLAKRFILRDNHVDKVEEIFNEYNNLNDYEKKDFFYFLAGFFFEFFANRDEI